MIVATIAVVVALSLIALRGETRTACLATTASVWLLGWLLWHRVEGIDTYAGFVALAVISVAIFSVALASGRQVKWSAGRAALLAALVYAITVPAMLRTPIDGDEPFYLLLTESMLQDRDVDLANQYGAIEKTASGRTDLQPQVGDPVGPDGEQYSRHEPFLALLMLPGYALGGLAGAIATIALFGVLLVRSTVRWMEEEGVDDRAIRAVFPFFAFAPPILFYATRIWPEVPAAFFFVEALRGIREERMKRWVPALLGLVLLKLRFVLVAAGLVGALLLRRKLQTRTALLAAAVAAIPLIVMWMVSGDPTNVHAWSHLVPAAPALHLRGAMGLIADGMSGIAFKAPFYLFALFALTLWWAKDENSRRILPEGFRLGLVASLLYLLYLVPRPEWFGGWAPPLRYLVFLMPVLALGVAAVWDRLSRGAVAIFAIWTIGLVIHGVAWPWRLFHIASGENQLGAWLSKLHLADFSRLFPSFIRLNAAAWPGVALVILIAFFGLRRYRNRRAADAMAVAVFTLLLSAGFHFGRLPAANVELEDAHVTHDGGQLHPELYAVMRVAYRGGWVLHAGESSTFLARAGEWDLHYVTGLGATIEVAGVSYHLPAGQDYQVARVTIPEEGRVTLRCLDGAVNIDRMQLDD
jgi:hypothetical protein